MSPRKDQQRGPYRASLSPHEIRPLHGVTNLRQRDELVEDMNESGWRGRPLIVIEGKTGYQAWTGSHRIAAAIEANLATVPCYVIPQELIDKYSDGLGLVADHDRLNLIRKTGDDTAIRLMWLENREY